VIQALARPAEIKQDHEHGVIVGQDIGLEVSNSTGSTDLG
jgi:hypothetical protein